MKYVTGIIVSALVAILTGGRASSAEKPISREDQAAIAELNQLKGVKVQTDRQGNILILNFSSSSDPVTQYGTAMPLLQRLHNVQCLFSDCVGTDDLLACAENWPALERIDLLSASVTDRGLKHLRGLQRLTHLCLRGTPVAEAEMRQIGALRSLRELNLMQTEATDAGLAHLGDLKHLEKLDLGCTPVSNAGLETIARLESLKSLVLYESKGITDAGLPTIAHMGKLEMLDLGDTDVTDAGVAHLVSLGKLRYLNLSGSLATEKVRQSFQELKDLEISGLRTAADLKRLDDPADVAAIRAVGVYVETDDLRNITKIDAKKDTQPSEWLSRLARLHDLKELVLPSCASDNDLITACQARTIKKLRLAKAAITNHGLKDIGNLADLHELSLAGCRRLSDGAARRLMALTNLEVLDLQETGMGDVGATQLAALRKIESLNLAGTDITDKTVASIDSLPLKSLILDSTRVTDKCLTHLLAHNKLLLLSIDHTNISQYGVGRLRNALPAATVCADLSQ